MAVGDNQMIEHANSRVLRFIARLRVLSEADCREKSLHQELEALWSSHNRGRGGFTLIAAEYLDVIATRL
jgi:hypothetical protein